MLAKFIAVIFKWSFKYIIPRKHFYGLYERGFLPKNSNLNLLYRSKYGFEILVNLADWIGARLYYIDEYENEEQAYLFQFLKEGQTIFDIGANAGLYSLLGAITVSKNGSVYSFEPMPQNQLKFKKNIELNNLSNIVLQPFAVSDRQASLTMEYVPENSGMATISNLGTTKVEAITIDSWIKSTDIKSVDFIKIDIEGHEWQALQGMEQTLKSYRPLLMIEIDDEIYQEKAAEKALLLSFLADLGYKRYSLNADGMWVVAEVLPKSTNYFFSI